MSDEKKYIRVNLFLENGQMVKSERKLSGYETTVDNGYEDLNLREDATKIELYLKSDYITLEDNNEYEVTKRIFQPNRPVMLCLYLKKIAKTSNSSAKNQNRDIFDDMTEEEIAQAARELPE